MIPVDLHHIFVIVPAFFLALLLFMVLYDTWRTRTRGWNIAEDRLGECSRCRLTFIISRFETVSRCPRCNALCPNSRRADGGARIRSR